MKLAEFKNPFTDTTHSLFDLKNIWLLIVGFMVWGVLRTFADRFGAQVDRWLGQADLGYYEEPKKKEKNGREVLA